MSRETKPEWLMTDKEAEKAFLARYQGTPGVTENELVRISRQWRSLRKQVANGF